MKVHTNNFKNEIAKMGRQISDKIYYYQNYNLITEDNNNILTEDNIQLVSEQINTSDKVQINNDLIYSMSFVKNGQLLQSLMKEFDFEAKFELKIGDIVNPYFGVLVSGSYEYLDFGNYVVYSKEFSEEKQTWNYVCYDKMLYSMIPYKPLNITYPCTIRDYLSAIADRIGLTFSNSNDTFTNYNQQVLKELFDGQNITYRDILDKLSEIVAGNLLINDSDELEIGYPTSTSDTINEDNLKDININFGEKFGVINKIGIVDSSANIEYVKENSQSIEQNGMTQVNIIDNIFAFNGNTNTICQNILNKLNGLYYYICDFKTTGICYYDFLDLFNVSANGKTYQCLLLNNEINVTSGLEETIFTDKFEESQTQIDNYKTSIIDNKQVQFKINQQEGKIESKVEKNGVISAINQSAEEIQINANKIKLEGYTTINDGFSVDLNGNMTANNATMNNVEIINGEIKLITTGSTVKFTIKDFNDSNIKWEQYAKGIDWYGTNGGHFRMFNTTGEPTIIMARQNDEYKSFISTKYIQMSKNNVNNVEISSDGDITCVSLTQTSKEEVKKNFEKYNNALDIIKNIDIYKYNLKEENDTDKKHIGFVIGDDFKYSKEITSKENDGVDLYSFISVCCKAIQEQQELIENLTQRTEKLERNDK